MADTDRRSAFVAGLRELADFYEQNPDFPEPSDKRFLLYSWQPEQYRQWAKALGGHREKYENGDSWAGVTRRFGGVVVQVYTDREKVCTRRVIGTETVVSTAVRCVHCDGPIARREADPMWVHVTIDGGWFRMCGTTVDDDGNEVGGQLATPPDFTATTAERPLVEWDCHPLLADTEAVGS